MKPKLSLIFVLISFLNIFICEARVDLTGMYFQWGYNKEWYTRSNIHFTMANGNDFVLHHAKAHDRTDFRSIITSTKDITVPQYNMRIGFYLNKKRTSGIELNFDHTKYIVTDFQKVHVTGMIDENKVNGDSILNKENFLHFEHTDGANFLHFNYFQLNTIIKHKTNERDIFSLIWKAGAGINIPRTDFTWRGNELNNKFHVAGYNASIEGGSRWNMSNHFFLEGTVKTGYVRYVNALANTETDKGNRVHHGFGYFECIWTLGYHIKFKKKVTQE